MSAREPHLSTADGAQEGPWSSPWRSWGCVPWILLALLWFATMPLRPLLDPDEGRYAEISREMLARGDWITPHLNGLAYFEKPPLQYWATAAAYRLFGVKEWTARLWPVGVSFLCLPMLFAWTGRCFGAAAARAALLALAVSPYFGLITQLNVLDGAFSLWVSGTVFAFVLAQRAPVGSGSERRWMLAAWVLAALAILSKGIVVGVLAGTTLVAYTLLERDPNPWRRLHLATGVPLLLAATAPWFIAVSLRNPSFPEFFFVHEHFARFLTTVHQRVEPWWYFLALLAIGALPWLRLLPAACRRAWTGELAGVANVESKEDYDFKSLKFLLLFSLVTVAFFSASESKLAPYILPMMPALTAIVGVHAASRGVASSGRFARGVAQFMGVLMPVLAVGFMGYAMRRYGYLPPACVPWLLAAASTSLLAAAFASWSQEPGRAGVVWVTAAAAITGWQCFLAAYTQLPERSAVRLVRTIAPLIGPRTQLFSIGQYRQTIPPYLQRTMTLVDFKGELAFGLSLEPAAELSDGEFLARWNAAADAVAFMNPAILEPWRARGFTGRVIGGDNETLAISRR